jgi:integrase
MSASLFPVYFGDDDDQSPIEAEKRAAVLKRPELAWRLREFYENWFRPRRSRKWHSSETDRNYLSSIRYWEGITDDWRLVDFLFDRHGADNQALDFTEQLPEWGYSRRGVPRGDQIRIGRVSEYPSFTPLTSITGREHASRIAHIFRKAGPEPIEDNRQHYAELLTRAPRVEVIDGVFDEKAPFAWAIARQIAAACGRMKRPTCPAWLPVELWYRLRLGLLFFTGLRMGTIVRIEPSHVLSSDDYPLLKVPKELVKTRKAIEMPIHAQLWTIIKEVLARRPPDAGELLVPECCSRRTFLDLHRELQELAGVPEDLRQSPHAWRRTHLSQIYELGAGRGLEAAQVAADHSDGRTTAKSYVATIVNHFRLRLPLLF